jgi:predicted enzyme related to lactoylglutathione lyase
MPIRLLAVAFDAHDPARMARFWAALLGRDVADEGGGVLLAGTDSQVGLEFVPSAEPLARPNRVHLHLTSADPEDQQRVVAFALSLGASHLDVGQRPEEGHVVLADPEGNEFCVIGPDSAYLAGCGPLGELACDGTRDVGLFWSDALGWPLVWDRDGETAIQSPAGGTKIGWGGPPVAPHRPGRRQRLTLVTDAEDAEAAARGLVDLGARRLARGAEGTVLLLDPDGNEFRVVAPS